MESKKNNCTGVYVVKAQPYLLAAVIEISSSLQRSTTQPNSLPHGLSEGFIGTNKVKGSNIGDDIQESQRFEGGSRGSKRGPGCFSRSNSPESAPRVFCSFRKESACDRPWNRRVVGPFRVGKEENNNKCLSFDFVTISFGFLSKGSILSDFCFCCCGCCLLPCQSVHTNFVFWCFLFLFCFASSVIPRAN